MSSSQQQLVEPVLYRIGDVARITSQSVRSIWRAIAEGKLEAKRLGPKRVRVTKQSLEAYLTNLEPVK